jgi:hypothetical protein
MTRRSYPMCEVLWLRRKRDGQMRVAFRSGRPSDWRVADMIGRTRVYGREQVERLFDVLGPASPPSSTVA